MNYEDLCSIDECLEHLASLLTERAVSSMPGGARRQSVSRYKRGERQAAQAQMANRSLGRAGHKRLKRALRRGDKPQYQRQAQAGTKALRGVKGGFQARVRAQQAASMKQKLALRHAARR